MKTVFHILNNTDLYEIAMDGRLIVRITKFLHGSQQQQEIHEWDMLPTDVKVKIESEAVKHLRK